MNYSEKLKDPRWQKKRLEILQRDSWRCRFCCDNAATLHVHHIAYQVGEPWDINNDLLITLCRSCHESETENIKEATTNLIQELKESGFMSMDFFSISTLFSESKNINWKFPPMPDIILDAIDNKKFLDDAQEKYWEKLKKNTSNKDIDQMPF